MSTKSFDSDKTFEHSKFAFRKIEQEVRVKRSILAKGTHQIGTTKRNSDLSGVELKQSILA